MPVKSYRVKRSEPARTDVRLAACVNVDDVRQPQANGLIACPRAVFDFVDGGADDEITQRENAAAFQAWRFSPRVLQNVGEANITTEFFGHNSQRYGAHVGAVPDRLPQHDPPAAAK